MSKRLIVFGPTGEPIYSGICKHGIFDTIDNIAARKILESFGYVAIPPVVSPFVLKEPVSQASKRSDSGHSSSSIFSKKPSQTSKAVVNRKYDTDHRTCIWGITSKDFDSSQYIGDRNPAFER